ncbi:MAG TPA: hypothetical protein VK149_04295 [Sideroxyarcus sp.]|nr:hypothetical protein [Sideroxyarcus sp.]
MTDSEITTILVKLGRIEEVINAMNAKLDTLEAQTERKFAVIDDQSDRMWRQISQLRTDVDVMRETMPKRAPWWTWLAVVAAAASFGLSILDRIFVNQ